MNRPTIDRVNKMTYQQHPLSAAFPAMSADDFAALRESIENIGVQNPITLYEGMVIDGWHRYSAATDLGMDCPVVELGDVDPRHFVLAQNKARRHITAAQLAMAVTEVYEWVSVGNPQFSQSRTGCMIGKTNAELAEAAGVSVRTVQQAKAVIEKASPEVAESVKRGEMGLKKAISTIPGQEAANDKRAKKFSSHAVDAIADDLASGAYEPDADELAENEAAQRADQEAMNKLLDADDKLAAAFAEIKRLNAELATMRASRDGYMNQCNELIARIKRLQKQIDRAQKVDA
jgi:ParB-like chromosome segregation protein Spo0J